MDGWVVHLHVQSIMIDAFRGLAGRAELGSLLYKLICLIMS